MKMVSPFFRLQGNNPGHVAIFYVLSVREAAKKVLLLMAGPLRVGWGGGRAIKEKITFDFYFVAKFQRPSSGGGG